MLQIPNGQHKFKKLQVDKEVVPNSEIVNEFEDDTKEGQN